MIDAVGSEPVLVDTDVFSWLMFPRKGLDVPYRQLVEGHYIALSFVTVGELLHGALQAGWGNPRLDVLRERIGRTVVLRSTDEVIEQYAEIRRRCYRQLKGGGENDMWTAACALAQPEPPPVVTGNTSDFGVIAEHFPLQLLQPST